ncbi:MAG: methyltransferase domain-containing protein [Opitutus sp.]
MNELQRRANELEPWVTQFSVLGQKFGGTYDALNDDRVSRVVEFFPRCRRILEVGCLEGGHTVILSRAYPYTDIVALDGRKENLEKAKFLTSLYGCKRVTFGLEDLEIADLSPYGKFDLGVCLGLLYHLIEPWKFIQQLGSQCDALWIWTTICDDASAETVNGKYRGKIFQEGPLDHALSALRGQSFFPTLGSLVQMLRDAGFCDFRVLNMEVTPDGPSVMLACTKQTFRLAGQ